MEALYSSGPHRWTALPVGVSSRLPMSLIILVEKKSPGGDEKAVWTARAWWAHGLGKRCTAMEKA